MAFTRSEESVEFEHVWRSLPRSGSIPARGVFEPRLAKRFLRHLILAQAPSPEDQTLRVHVAGDAVVQQVQADIVGTDFLDFIEGPSRRSGALSLIGDMFEQSLGLWWVAPVHYERGYALHWEVTALPLAADDHHPAMVVALVLPFDPLLATQAPKGTAVRIDPAIQLERIQIAPAA